MSVFKNRLSIGAYKTVSCLLTHYLNILDKTLSWDMRWDQIGTIHYDLCSMSLNRPGLHFSEGIYYHPSGVYIKIFTMSGESCL